MKRSYIVPIVICAALLGIGSLGAPHLIALAASQVAELEVSFVTPPTQYRSWWQQLAALLGIRSVGKIQPPIGTKLLVQSSAYASSPYQTDSTPCITAAGTRVRPGVVATNFLPMGTILEINGEKYIVEDRMNSRYKGYYLDVWLPSTSEALVFGRKGQSITIVDYGTPGQEIREDITNEKEPAKEKKPVKKPAAVTPQNDVFSLVKDGVSSLAYGLSTFIGTRLPPDVNKYDVDCLNDDAVKP